MHLIQVAQSWVGSCERGNEPSRSTNGWQCLDCLNTRLASKETLCFTELLMIILLQCGLSQTTAVTELLWYPHTAVMRH